jgi:Spy/CpxP family protein refolding chaperone
MDKRKIGGVGALIAVLVAVAWWLGWFSKAEDPLVAKTRQLVATPQTEQTPQQRTDLRDAWRDRFQGLNEEQRMALFEQMAPIFMPLMMRQFETRYDEFMAMTPEQQRAELDKRIDEMQKRNPSGQGGGQFGGSRPQMAPEKAAEFQKKMLAWTTPEQRAKFQNGMMMFANRMKERGLNPPQMPGGGFF